MVMSASNKTKVIRLIGIYDKLYKSLSILDSPILIKLADSWMQARSKYFDIIEDRVIGIKSAALINGMEQGLREFPDLINDLPKNIAEQSLNIYRSVLAVEYPDFDGNNLSHINHIIESGVIKNEKEFYLVRESVDRFEKAGDKEKLKSLYHILENYEKS